MSRWKVKEACGMKMRQLCRVTRNQVEGHMIQRPCHQGRSKKVNEGSVVT